MRSRFFAPPFTGELSSAQRETEGGAASSPLRSAKPTTSPVNGGGKKRFVWIAVAIVATLVAAPLAPAFAQPSAESAVPRGVAVARVVSPGGIEVWLVSDATVPMIVVNAYWAGGHCARAIQPDSCHIL